MDFLGGGGGCCGATLVRCLKNDYSILPTPFALSRIAEIAHWQMGFAGFELRSVNKC
ncbi:MAG: hypothetical protein ACRERX_03285 [Pseudomonas sp.]